MSRKSNQKYTARRRAGGHHGDSPGSFARELLRIDRLIEEQHLNEALDGAERLAQRYPNNIVAHELMFSTTLQLDDHRGLLVSSLHLTELEPSVPDHMYNLFQAYIQATHPALAVQTGRELLRRWPAFPDKNDFRKGLDHLTSLLQRDALEGGLQQDGWLEILALHERIQVAQLLDQLELSRQLAAQLLEVRPGFVPAYNNSSLSWFQEGNFDEAIANARRALDFDPGNVHALSNLIRFFLASGKLDEARLAADKLKATECRDGNATAKIAEGLSFLGDDAGVLELTAQADPSDPLVLHLAGVAAARLGDEKRARTLWQEAIKRFPFFTRSAKNLEDLEKPTGEREGPWPFELEDWLSPRILDEFKKMVAKRENGVKSSILEEHRKDARRFVQKYPGVLSLMPLLLERGDPFGREFAIGLAQIIDTPETLPILKEYAQGPNGTDDKRFSCLRILRQSGLIQRGEQIPFWAQGEKTEIQVTDFNIDDVPYDQSPPGALEYSTAGVRAMKEGKLHRAERSFLKALQRAPSSASIRYNLATLEIQKGNVAKAKSMLESISLEHPQYGFALCQLALIEMASDRLDAGDELLNRVGGLPHFQYDEFAMYCRARILHSFLSKSSLEEEPKSWLHMWKQALPGDPRLEEFEELASHPLRVAARAKEMLTHFRERRASK